MVFSSVDFLYFFLPITLIVYYIAVKIGNVTVQNGILVIASFLFYAYGEPVYVLLMVVSICCNYAFGFGIQGHQSINKLLFVVGIIFNLGLLGIFKYSGFIISNINILMDTDFKVRNVPLPIGISFYTFQILSYLVDVYKGERDRQKNVCKLALYISFFPQLIAGPIIRYGDFADQIDNRTHTLKKTEWGGVSLCHRTCEESFNRKSVRAGF